MLRLRPSLISPPSTYLYFYLTFSLHPTFSIVYTVYTKARLPKGGRSEHLYLIRYRSVLLKKTLQTDHQKSIHFKGVKSTPHCQCNAAARTVRWPLVNENKKKTH